MRQSGYLFFTALLFLCSFSFAITAKKPQLDPADNCYIISNVEELYGFACFINGSSSLVDCSSIKMDRLACGKLTADIVVNEHLLKNADGTSNVDADGFFTGTYTNKWKPLMEFAGKFYGQGHTISGLYVTPDVCGGGGAGFLASIDDQYNSGLDTVIVKDLGIVDSYFYGRSEVGALSGRVFGTMLDDSLNVYVSNVYADAYVKGVPKSGSSSVSVGGLFGSIVGFVFFNMENSYSAVTVNGATESRTGAVIGKTDLSNMKSYSKARVVLNNVYYTNESNLNVLNEETPSEGTTVNPPELTNVVKADAQTLADGTIAAALHNYERLANKDNPTDVDGAVWGQGKLLPDFSGKIAVEDYYTAKYWIDGSVAKTFYYKYGTKYDMAIFGKEEFSILGFFDCADFNCFRRSAVRLDKPTDGTKGADTSFYMKVLKKDNGCHVIANADDLYKFSNIVNNDNAVAADTAACGKLVADIIVNPNVLKTKDGVSNVDENGNYIGETENLKVWDPIGRSSEHKFVGEFHGQGFSISGLFLNNSSYRFPAGLFGFAGSAGWTAKVDNLGIRDSYMYGQKNVGGIAGYGGASSTKGGGLQIVNSYYDGYVRVSSSTVGGFVADAGEGSLTITNSFALARLTGGTAGGVVGYTGHAKKVELKNVFYLDSDKYSALNNSFRLNGADSVKAEGFVNGSLAVKLHDYVSSDDGLITGAIWGQNLVSNADRAADEHPELSHGKGVITFPISYELNGGSLSGAAKSYNYGDEAYELPAPSREHYSFAGWYSDKDFAEKSKVESVPEGSAAPIMVYANWEIEKYDIGVAVNAPAMGSVSGGGTYAYGTEITLTATAADGYQFSNWEDDLEALAERTITVSESKTYTANFKVIPEPESSSSVIPRSSSVIPASSSNVIPDPDPESSSSSAVVITDPESSSSVIPSSSSVIPASSSSVIPDPDPESQSSSSSAVVKQSSSSIKAEKKSSSSVTKNSSSSVIPGSSSNVIPASSSSVIPNSSSVIPDPDPESQSSSSSSAVKRSSSSSKNGVKSSSSKKTDVLLATAVPRFALSVANRNIQIAGAPVGSAYAILDMQGRVMVAGLVESANFNVPITRSGNYFVRIGSLAKQIQIH